jgi:hypothetical protein
MYSSLSAASVSSSLGFRKIDLHKKFILRLVSYTVDSVKNTK